VLAAVAGVRKAGKPDFAEALYGYLSDYVESAADNCRPQHKQLGLTDIHRSISALKNPSEQKTCMAITDREYEFTLPDAASMRCVHFYRISELQKITREDSIESQLCRSLFCNSRTVIRPLLQRIVQRDALLTKLMEHFSGRGFRPLAERFGLAKDVGNVSKEFHKEVREVIAPYLKKKNLGCVPPSGGRGDLELSIATSIGNCLGAIVAYGLSPSLAPLGALSGYWLGRTAWNLPSYLTGVGRLWTDVRSRKILREAFPEVLHSGGIMA
jgi:hypothetical protein